MNNNLMTMFEHGGPIFYVIIVLSVVALGLVIERLIWLWRSNLEDETFFNQFTAMLDESADKEQLLEYCSNDSSSLAAWFHYGVEHSELGLLAFRRVMLDYFNDEIKVKLENNLNWLSTIGKAAPMLGLFGTVYGMMGAFNAMSQAETQAKPSDLAGDINIALATTVGGLFVALLVVAFHSFISHRVRRRQQDYQRRLGRVLKPLMDLSGQ